MPIAMWTPGPLELIVLLVIIMMFFGVGKLPEVGNALGKSLRAFKDAQKPDELDVTPTTEDLDVQEAREVTKDQA